LCKDHKGRETVRGIHVALYLLYIMYHDCDKILTSYTECICKTILRLLKSCLLGRHFQLG